MVNQLIFFVCLAAVVLQSLGNAVQSSTRRDANSKSARHSFILLGASGDLADHEIYPSLWYLYRENLIPKDIKIVGYALDQITIDDLRQKVSSHIKVKSDEKNLYDKFWSLNKYIAHSDSESADYEKISRSIDKFENCGKGNRLYYLALPPAVFWNATSQIKRTGMAKNGWTRIVVEKPFGFDLESAKKLGRHLAKLFAEDQIYRVDHFLNYDTVQNIFTMKYGNRLLRPAWNRDNIASIEIDLRENQGIEHHGALFDKANIIRQVTQNHLLQMMSLIAMERPKSNSADDVRDAKVELLKATREVVMDDVVLGQYVANPHSKNPRYKIGYRDEPKVPDNSITATFALTVLKVDNKRWRGVPFILKAGKAMDKNRTRIIIQFKDVDEGLLNDKPKRNELILTVKGKEGLKAKITSKVPGISNDIEEIELDFKYAEKHKGLVIDQAYQKTILGVFRGSQSNFVRFDEVIEAWRIFTPILHEIDNKKIRPIEYKFGTAGPTEADKMERKNNFLK